MVCALNGIRAALSRRTKRMNPTFVRYLRDQPYAAYNIGHSPPTEATKTKRVTLTETARSRGERWTS